MRKNSHKSIVRFSQLGTDFKLPAPDVLGRRGVGQRKAMAEQPERLIEIFPCALFFGFGPQRIEPDGSGWE